MKKTIILSENEITLGDKTIQSRIGLMKESMFSSIISDTYTFGIMLLSFWVNQQYIHSKTVSVILLFCFLFSLSFGTKTKKVTKEEFKKYVEEVLG